MQARDPDFLYIGAPKAGSSWLFEALRAHPGIFVPPAKDLQFFDRNYSLGGSWYRNAFALAGAERIAGELSHDYFLSDEAAERIRRSLPEVKLLCCLREPGDLTLSAHRYARNHSPEFAVDLPAYAELPIARAQVDYLRNLRRFYDRFPAGQILVAFYDELRDEPEAFLLRVYRFLGADETFTPPVLRERINTAKRARSIAVAGLAYRVAGWLRQRGLANVVGAVKRSPLFDRVLYRPDSGDAPSLEERRCLARIRLRAVRDYPALEELTGRSIPRAWYDVAEASRSIPEAS